MMDKSCSRQIMFKCL